MHKLEITGYELDLLLEAIEELRIQWKDKENTSEFAALFELELKLAGTRVKGLGGLVVR